MEALLYRECLRRAQYCSWANLRLYMAITPWLVEESVSMPPVERDQVLDLLNRLLMSSRIWLPRIRGLEPDLDSPDERLYQDPESLRDAQTADDVALCEHVHGLSEAEMLRPIPYQDFDGVQHSNAQHELLTELMLQQEQVRGRICQSLAARRHKIPVLSFLGFLRDARPARSG